MRRVVLSILGLAIMTLAFSSSTVMAMEPAVWIDGQNLSAKHMNIYGAASQPIGHVGFCKRFPKDCRYQGKKRRPMRLSKARWKQLARINSYANKSVLPITDLDHHGIIEHWDYPRKRGDCEDYVLLKRKMLIARGWSPANLLVTVVRDELGDGHAVLTASTSAGDFILDNKTPKIYKWNKVPYQFIKRQSTRHAGKWVSLLPRRPINTAKAN